MSIAEIINKPLQGKDIVDLTHLDWKWSGLSNGSSGTLPKTFHNGKFYKTSKYNLVDGFIGKEAVYEVICYRLFKQLGVESIPYNLVKALVRVNNKEYTTYICVSDDFSKHGYTRISMERLLLQQGKEPIDFALQGNYISFFVNMILCDFITGNCDRHGANIEFYTNGDIMYPVPLFDNGSCLFYNHFDEGHFSDMMYENPVANSVFGYKQHSQLLNMFKPYIKHSTIKPYIIIDWDEVFVGMNDCLTEIHKKAIIDVVKYRYRYVSSILEGVSYG